MNENGSSLRPGNVLIAQGLYWILDLNFQYHDVRQSGLLSFKGSCRPVTKAPYINELLKKFMALKTGFY